MIDVQKQIHARHSPLTMGNQIDLEGVDIVTPAGNCLMNDLSISVDKSIMVTGGKVSFDFFLSFVSLSLKLTAAAKPHSFVWWLVCGLCTRAA